jgi:integrase
MTLTLAPDGPPRSSPLAALMAAVRPEHRGDLLTPEVGHPLVDRGLCRVPDCPGMATAGRGLCVAHADRWYRARRRGVDFDSWLQDCPPRCTPQACLVPGCRFGRHRSQLCHHHHTEWAAIPGAGGAKVWAATVRLELSDQPSCKVQGCDLSASFGDGFCVSHQGRFNAFRRRTGTADRAAFLAAVALAGRPRIDLTGLAAQLELEVQYVVQCFLDEGPRRVNLTRWNAVVRALHARGATSLLEHTAAEWVAALRLGHGNPDGALFIRWGHDQVDRLVHGTGWDREYPLDTWTLDRVGHAATGVARITFTAIAQPWLRGLAKQWARHRLSIGIGPAGVRRGISVLGQFSTHLDGLAHPPQGAGSITRLMVQRWCEDLCRDHPEPRARLQLVTALSTFLRDVHRYGWAPELASTTVVFSEDFPRLHGTGPGRALTDYVVAQIESDEALARLTHPDHQLMTRIMIRCGLRSGDCRLLGFDCLVHDGEGHPYLQYLNHKMKRTAFMPLDDDLAARIRDQQRNVLQRFDHRPGLRLFPGHASNPHGTKAYPASGYRATFQGWLADLRITDELGRPVWITPHQLRHTFGTRMINRDVPQHIVQQLMDHTSADMTAHYARLNDKTVRDAWAKAQLIDAHGNPVKLDDDHPLADAAWARRGLDRAKQTLPNGYCGMPLNSPCEHANPCLTCPMFITNADFLPQHETQLKHTLELIDISREKGHLRVVEKNQEIVDNLQRIITTCQTCPATTEPKAADAR